MEALTNLLQDIKFRERFRGYDSDEVDAYVIAVAKAAAQLQGRLMELQQRVQAAEALIADRGNSGDGNGASLDNGESGEAENSPYQVLALAQRTADGAVAEARHEASSIVEAARQQAEQTLAEAAGKANAQIAQADGDARSRLQETEYQCSLLRAEAEADRERILEEARRRAIEVAEAERDRIMAEVSGLEAVRTGLRAEVDTLQSCRSEHLSMLTGSMAAMQTAIEGLASVSPLSAPPAEAAVKAPPAVAGGAGFIEAPLAAPPSGAVAEAPPAASGKSSAVTSAPSMSEAVEAPLATPSAGSVVEAPSASRGDAASLNGPAAFQAAPEQVTVEPPEQLMPEPPGQAMAEPVAAEDSLEFASGASTVEEPSAADFDTSGISDLVPPTPPNRLVTATDIDMVAAGLNVLDRRQTASASALAAPDMPGPPTQLMPVVAGAVDSATADKAPSFFDGEPDRGLLVDQLRQAVTEEDPLPGSEEAMVAFFGADPGARSKGWFRARR